jgi:predicted peptidase
MNVVRRFVAIVHATALELLLVLSILLLIGQLSWPIVVHWWRLPGPGQIGFDAYKTRTMANEFLIQLPSAYRKRERWPLIVFLHGSGYRGRDPSILRSQTVFQQSLPAIVVAPECLPDIYWEPDAVANFTDYVASRYFVDHKRIYLVGHSMGACGAWATASNHSDLFAAIVPISGAGDPQNAKSLAHVPIWAFHGAKDRTISITESERMIEAVREAGGHPRFTILQGAGHAISQSVCKRTDLWEWLLQQHRDK